MLMPVGLTITKLWSSLGKIVTWPWPRISTQKTGWFDTMFTRHHMFFVEVHHILAFYVSSNGVELQWINCLVMLAFGM